jgi:hypothetical protein
VCVPNSGLLGFGVDSFKLDQTHVLTGQTEVKGSKRVSVVKMVNGQSKDGNGLSGFEREVKTDSEIVVGSCRVHVG